MSHTLKRIEGKQYSFEKDADKSLKIGIEIPLDGVPRKSLCPGELVLGALAGCASSAVISVCTKKGKLDRFEVETGAVYDKTHPSHRFREITLLFKIWGSDITDEAVEKGIELALEKYCTVAFSLHPDIKIHHDYILNLS